MVYSDRASFFLNKTLAWLACGVLAACGSVKAAEPDGGQGDAASADANRQAPRLSQLVLPPGFTLEPSFDPEVFSYQVNVSVLPQAIIMVPTAVDSLAEIMVDGQATATNAASPPVTLNFGANQIDIAVSLEDLTSTYQLAVNRGAAAVSQDVYGKASNTQANDQFAYSIAMSGDLLVVGAPREDSDSMGVDGPQGNNLSPDSGAVYVFRRTLQGWMQEAYLKADNTGASDLFGWSVAVSGNTIAVGAITEDGPSNTAPDSGAVYVFRHVGGTWAREAYIKASSSETFFASEFGFSVGLDNNTLVVGAPKRNTNVAVDVGAAYVFTRSQGSWTEDQEILGQGQEDQFGFSVAVFGDRMVVGAPFEDSSAQGVHTGNRNNGAGNSGAAYVYVKGTSTWSEEAFLKSSNTSGDFPLSGEPLRFEDRFGTSVSIFEDTIAVGAPFEDGDPAIDEVNNMDLDSGAVEIFHRTNVWAHQQYIKSPNSDRDDRFGWSVALSKDLLAVGAIFEDSASSGIDGPSMNNGDDTGAVYVSSRTSDVWTHRSYVKASNTDNDDNFGWSVALSGGQLSVGSRTEAGSTMGLGGSEGNGASNSGAVYILR